jgi:hypothetical protein
VEATVQKKVKVRPCRVKTQGLGLNWLCVAIALLKALFCERGLFSRVKPKIYDRAALFLEMLDFWCCLGGVSVDATRNLSL